MAANFDLFNPIFMMADPGARGNIKQRFGCACRHATYGRHEGRHHLIFPLSRTLREGLSVLEQLRSPRTALERAWPTPFCVYRRLGYLTRRLVRRCYRTVVHLSTAARISAFRTRCTMKRAKPGREHIGRHLLQDVKAADGLVPWRATTITSPRPAGRWGGSRVASRKSPSARSATCHAEHGVPEVLRLGSPRAVRSTSHGGRHHCCPVHWRARHAADHAYVPRRRRCRRGHHARPAACPGMFEARKPKGQAVLAEISRHAASAPTRTQDADHPRPGRQTRACGVRPAPPCSRAWRTVARFAWASNHEGLHQPARPAAPDRLGTPRCAAIGPGPGRVRVPGRTSTTSTSRLSRARCCCAAVAVLTWPIPDLPGRQVNRFEFENVANGSYRRGQEPAGGPAAAAASRRPRWPRIRSCPPSLQETTKVSPTPPSREGADHLVGLKENVIIGKRFPAGTGLEDITATWALPTRAKPTAPVTGDTLPDYAPDDLRKIEDSLPQPQDWSLGRRRLLNMGGKIHGSYYSGLSLMRPAAVRRGRAPVHLR